MEKIIKYICNISDFEILSDDWWNSIKDQEIIYRVVFDTAYYNKDFERDVDFDWLRVELLDPHTGGVLKKHFAIARRAYIDNTLSHFIGRRYSEYRENIFDGKTTIFALST